MQPLVENAIRHGISKRREGGTVTVAARRENELLRISVEDDGVGLPAEWRRARRKDWDFPSPVSA